MEESNKKIILNCICAVALFFALTGAAQLVLNAANMSAFNSPGESNIQGHDSKFVEYTSQSCFIAAIISLAGLALFINDFFVRRKKTHNILLIVLEILFIAALIVLASISAHGIPKYVDGDHEMVYLQEFSLYSNVQGMYVQQIIVFAVLLVICVYQKQAAKKEAIIPQEPTPS